MKTWTRIVRAAVTTTEFTEAWREVGEAGIASAFPAKKVRELLLNSKYHQQRLLHHAIDIAQLCNQSMEEPATKENTERLVGKLASTITDIASVYMVIGTLVGIGSVIGVNSRADDK